MGLLNNLLGGGNAQPQLQKFKRTYTLADFGVTANVSIPANSWTSLGTVTVPAQQQVTFGSNDPVGGGSVAGAPVYIQMDTTTEDTRVSGKVRLAITNANETNTVVVMEETTQKMASSRDDRTKAVLLPEYPLRAKEDSKLQILIFCTGAQTLDYDATDTEWSIPVTVYQ